MQELNTFEHASKHHRLIGNNANRAAFNATKTNHDILGMGFLNFEEVAFINDLRDQFLNIVRLVGIIRHQRIKRHLDTLAMIKARPFGQIIAIG